MHLSKTAVALSFIGFSVVAVAMPQDYFFSIYGAKAKKYFDSLPKVTSSCAYSENSVDANGNDVDNLKLKIGGQKIESILCRHIGESTYACEASTLLNSGACKTN